MNVLVVIKNFFLKSKYCSKLCCSVVAISLSVDETEFIFNSLCYKKKHAMNQPLLIFKRKCKF